MKIAISLIWLRVKGSGGVESFTRNLLDGFRRNDAPNHYYLLCSRDNYDSFIHYAEDERFFVLCLGTATDPVWRNILYESFCLDAKISSLGVDFCFVPCYRMPIFRAKNRYIIVVHDLIAHRFPGFFPRMKRYWLQYSNRIAAERSFLIIAISEFVKREIVEICHVDERKITMIYNPILPNVECASFPVLKKKFNIEKQNYLYTLVQCGEHKNLMTLLRLMDYIRISSLAEMHLKLLISGVGRNRFLNSDMYRYIKRHNLDEMCIHTGYVENDVRNALMKHSLFFLFPSTYEGFGMPPIEAMELGASVVTTKCASILEVTRNKCYYINDPFSVEEWYQTIFDNIQHSSTKFHFREYETDYVAGKYLAVFRDVMK